MRTVKIEDFAVIKCNGNIVGSGTFQTCSDNAAHYNSLYQTDEYVVEKWVNH